MKNAYLIIITLMLIPIISHAQHSCCIPDANAKFASFAAEAEFIRAHDLPLPYHGESLAGTMISFPCASGANGSAYLAASDKHPNKVILMFHEFWGLNDYIKSEADNLSKELGVTVCAIDLYDGKVATTREDASKYLQALTSDRGNALIDGAVTYFGKNVRFGTIGWCMGGTWSQQAAIRAGSQSDACVIYYGMPETDQAKLKEMHAHVLGIFGNKDKWISPKVVSDYKEAMKKAGKKLIVHSYEADHAFANPSNPNHDKAATEEAHKFTIAFFKREMQLFQ
ncbi:MAG: dienelactone hydrolase family protein [Bacteroidota bacterium]|nr:dienelactone hydrolase family protein [Bacteroidota bacterium]MDP4229922.1 dienelactone hydrolase family protein [Bacteroidota bacterium]MDP4237371.1 dienelactone hydrolase family protein [Bacteroidota bacterium]